MCCIHNVRAVAGTSDEEMGGSDCEFLLDYSEDMSGECGRESRYRSRLAK